MKLNAKKILVMRYRFIGDTVLTVPFLRNLREAYPAAHIDLMLEPFSGKVIEGCPYVDRVIPFEFRTIHTYSSKAERSAFRGYLHYWRVIREEKYDAAFVLKRSFSSALLACAARVPRRIGFATEGRGILLTDPVTYRHDQHEVENFLDCLRVIGAPISSKRLELWPSLEAEGKVHALLAQAGWKRDDLKIIIHLAASLPAKQWPIERFAAVMRALQERYHARFIYTGALQDRVLYEELEGRGPFGGLNLCGVTDIRENISVYRAADLYFGVDSGPMHVAAAVGVPVVALFGPTNEIKWGPWGDGHIVLTKKLSCRSCKPHKCSNFECMTRISIDEALHAVSMKIESIMPKVFLH